MRKVKIFISLTLLLSMLLGFAADTAAAYTPTTEVSAESAYMVNLDTDIVVYAKNEHEQRSPASLTKIMTTIIAMEEVDDLNGTMVTAQAGFDSSLYGLNPSLADIRAGETHSMYELICAMMIHSGNDAALAVGYYLGGGDLENFYRKMNAKAREIGALETNFASVNGLTETNNYSTAYDMYLIARYAMDIPGFMDICSMTRYQIEENETRAGKLMITTNKLQEPNHQYYYPDARGIKTGYTEQAGRCLVSTATRNGLSYLLVVMGCPTTDASGATLEARMHFVDSINLYDWAFDTFEIKELLSNQDWVAEVPLTLAWNKDFLRVKPAETFSYLVPKDIDAASVERHVITETSVEAPVTEGTILGKIDLILAGETIGQVDLIAVENVERSSLLALVAQVQGIFGSIWFKVALIAIILLVLGYILLMIRHNRRRRYKMYKPPHTGGKKPRR